MIERVDVAVIGLGPAGSAAAAAAARGGARVMAFDRRRVAGVPVQCAEFVPAMLGIDVGPVNTALVQPIEAMESFVEFAGDKRSDDFKGRMIDRAAFDQHLAEQARAAGAVLAFGVQLAGIGSDGLLSLADGRRVRANVVIGADGPHSRVGRAIGAVNRALVETRQITVALRRPRGTTDIYLSARIPGGYAWLFPRGKVANVGLGIDRRWRARLKPELESLVALLAEEGTIDPAPLGHTGGAIPVSGAVEPVGRLGETDVLLAGDAAGLANPVTGAGIPAACQSGRLAGEAGARLARGDARAAADYAEEIDDLFGVSLGRAVARREALLACYTDGRVPTHNDLRRGWIAYAPYWAPLDEEKRTDELLEA